MLYSNIRCPPTPYLYHTSIQPSSQRIEIMIKPNRLKWRGSRNKTTHWRAEERSSLANCFFFAWPQLKYSVLHHRIGNESLIVGANLKNTRFCFVSASIDTTLRRNIPLIWLPDPGYSTVKLKLPTLSYALPNLNFQLWTAELQLPPWDYGGLREWCKFRFLSPSSSLIYHEVIYLGLEVLRSKYPGSSDVYSPDSIQLTIGVPQEPAQVGVWESSIATDGAYSWKAWFSRSSSSMDSMLCFLSQYSRGALSSLLILVVDSIMNSYISADRRRDSEDSTVTHHSFKWTMYHIS